MCFVEAKPIVLTRRIPSFELNDELDAFGSPCRGHAEEILDVDQSNAADLHVVAGELGTRADHE